MSLEFLSQYCRLEMPSTTGAPTVYTVTDHDSKEGEYKMQAKHIVCERIASVVTLTFSGSPSKVVGSYQLSYYERGEVDQEFVGRFSRITRSEVDAGPIRLEPSGFADNRVWTLK